jgi:tetratricopeptide (TPR) repeat protein
MKDPAFVSYARKDSDFVRRLVEDLKARGANVWLDQSDIQLGQRWDAEVERALRMCGEMLVILSPASVESRNVMDEVTFALDKGKKIIPVLHQKCEIPFRLGRLNYVDLASDYEHGLQKLLTGFEANIETDSADRPGRTDRTVRWRWSVRSLRWLTPGVLLPTLALWMSFPAIARWCNNRGVENQQLGHLTSAVEEYKRALELHPSSAQIHYNLAGAYEELSDYDKAAGEYRRALEADDTFYPAYNNLSRVYILRGDYAAALSLLDRGLSFKPREMSVQYSLYKNRGWANLGLGLVGQAELDLRRALALRQDGGAAFCLLAQVQEAHGKHDAIVPSWESCVAYGSEQKDVEPSWLSLAQEHLRRADENGKRIPEAKAFSPIGSLPR